LTLVVDGQLLALFGGVVALLVVASAVGAILARTVRGESGRVTVENLNGRIRAWWGMAVVFAIAVAGGRIGAIVLFGLVSFLALREFITLTPTRRADHQTLFWSFFAITPLQYYLVAAGWYGLFSILIPVYAFLFVPIASAIAGDTDGFLERIATIQWGLMVCVYCVSHAPGLLMLHVPGYEGQNAKLLLFLLLVVQLGDVLQYVWGRVAGRHPIAPRVSPNKTWEGFVGGVGSATLIGAALWWATPFRPGEAAGLALLATLMGFAGGLTMSAIKRDRGVKHYGATLEGHGGILDRIDSVCFAAPVFFHVTRYFFAARS
jgi:phosphatidate cytidylyltransferase